MMASDFVGFFGMNCFMENRQMSLTNAEEPFLFNNRNIAIMYIAQLKTRLKTDHQCISIPKIQSTLPEKRWMKFSKKMNNIYIHTHISPAFYSANRGQSFQQDDVAFLQSKG